MLSCHQELHFGKCIVSRYVNHCPVCLYVYFHVCSSHGPFSFLLFPPSLSPPSISPWAPVFLQVERETWRDPPQERMRRSQGNPASLQQRSVGIHPVVRSLETWTSSRSLLWRDRQSLEKRERRQQTTCMFLKTTNFILFESDKCLLVLPLSPSHSCISLISLFFAWSELYHTLYYVLWYMCIYKKITYILINPTFCHYYSIVNKLIKLSLEKFKWGCQIWPTIYSAFYPVVAF